MRRKILIACGQCHEQIHAGPLTATLTT